MAFVEDFTCYFADFGVDATLDGAAVRVIFDDAFQGAGFGPRDMASSGPQAMVPTADVPAQPYALVLAVTGRGTYNVVSHQADGTGMSLLLLERAA